MKTQDYYAKYQKEYGLPHFEQLENTFHILDIEDCNLLKIAEKMIEKFHRYREILESLLHADGNSLAVLMEVKFLDEDDQTLINEIYKEIIIADRNYLLADLAGYDEKAYAELIKQLWQSWETIVPNLEIIVKKMRDSWESDKESTDDPRYVG